MWDGVLRMEKEVERRREEAGEWRMGVRLESVGRQEKGERRKRQLAFSFGFDGASVLRPPQRLQRSNGRQIHNVQ